MQQIWIGGHDAAGMLLSIGGWHLSCENHHEYIEAVEWADQQGYLARRLHIAPAFPDGVLAFELTDHGIEAIGRYWGEKAKISALKMRQWYRDRKP